MAEFDKNEQSEGHEEMSKEASKVAYLVGFSPEHIEKNKLEGSLCQDGVCMLLWKPRPRLA